MKFRRFEFESVVGDAESAPCFARFQIEENRDVGQKSVYCGSVDRFDKIRAQTASITLIGYGTVNVSVAYHEFAALECRLDDLTHELRS